MVDFEAIQRRISDRLSRQIAADQLFDRAAKPTFYQGDGKVQSLGDRPIARPIISNGAAKIGQPVCPKGKFWDIKPRLAPEPIITAPAIASKWAILYTVENGDDREFWLKTATFNKLIYTIESVGTYGPNSSETGNAYYAIITILRKGIDPVDGPFFSIDTERSPLSGSGAEFEDGPFTVASCPSPADDPSRSNGFYIKNALGGTLSGSNECTDPPGDNILIGMQMYNDADGLVGDFPNPQEETLGVNVPYEAHLSGSSKGWHIAIKSETTFAPNVTDPDEFAIVAIAQGKDSFLFTEYENPTAIADSAENWKNPLTQSYLAEADYVYDGADACVSDYIETNDINIVGETAFYQIDLTQDIDGTALQDLLEANSAAVSVTLATATLESNGSCTVTPGADETISIKGPGRGTVLAIAYYKKS